MPDETAANDAINVTPPRPSASVCVVNGMVMLGMLIAASYIFARCWDLEHWISWAIGGTMCLLLGLLFLVVYGAIFRRREWLATGAASILGMPGALIVLSLPGWLTQTSPQHSTIAMALAALTLCGWGYWENRRWARELADWEARCRLTGGPALDMLTAQGLWRFNLRELLLLTLIVAILIGVSRAMIRSHWI